MPWIRCANGFRSDVQHNDPTIAGRYEFRDADVTVYKPCRRHAPDLGSDEHPGGAERAAPTDLGTMGKPNTVGYKLLLSLRFPRTHRLESPPIANVYFDVPCTSVTPHEHIEDMPYPLLLRRAAHRGHPIV